MLECVTWTIKNDYGGFNDKRTWDETIDECRAHCLSIPGCTAIDWVASNSRGKKCWMVGRWTTTVSNREPGIQRHTFDESSCG